MSPASGDDPLAVARTLPDLLDARVKASGSRPSYRFRVGGGWRTVTWSEFKSRVDEVALGFSRLGVKPGHTVAVVANTRPEWCITEMAALRLGGVTAGICPEASPAHLAKLLNHSRSRLVCVEDREQLEKIRLVADRLRTVEDIVVWDVEGPVDQPRERSFYAVTRLGREASAANREQVDGYQRAIDPDATALLIYTAGTTGASKGVCLSHRNVLSALDSMRVLPFSEDDHTVSYLPMCLAAEKLIGFYGRLASGMSTSFAKSPRTVLLDLGEVKPTVFGSVPRLFDKLHADWHRELEEGALVNRLVYRWALGVGRDALAYQLENRPLPPVLSVKHRLADALLFSRLRARLGENLRYVIVGAAPSRREVLEFFLSIGLPLYEAYGLTECSALAAANLPGSAQVGTVGKPLPGCEVRIADDGEVLIRGGNVFTGYLGDEEATARTIDADGWLHTGDIGRFDADGFLVITDRKKNVIITAGGKSVAPHIIEDLLKRDAAVSHVVVVGDRRPFLTALVALEPDEAPDLAARLGVEYRGLDRLARAPALRQHIQSLVDRANEELSASERIVAFQVLPQPLSPEAGDVTAAQGVRRSAILAKYADLIEAMYAE